MTWPDLALIILFVFFIGLGARLGSLWTGSCILGGFFGAALVDYYTLPLAEMMGNFVGSTVLAAIGLYAVGLAAMMIPGSVLSKMGSAFFLGILDSAFGLFTGAFTGLFLIAVLLMLIIPMFPQLEKTPAYKNSAILKPFETILEEIFTSPPFHAASAGKRIKKEARQKIVPLSRKAKKTAQTLKKQIPALEK